MDYQGLILCAKYSSAPNFYGYCGPDENETLVGNLVMQHRQKEILSILSEFETLYLYLRLISTENKLADPFDRRVVEAYWVGNSLLHSIPNMDYDALLREKFDLEKKIGFRKYVLIRRKVLHNRFYPHHSFHVFNIFKRTGYDTSFHTLRTMDECRIGWGRIKMKNEKSKMKYVSVETKPLIIRNNQLTLGNPITRELRIDYRGKTFLHDFKPGDWVSFHWGFVCDRLTKTQLYNLQYYTRESIDFYNA